MNPNQTAGPDVPMTAQVPEIAPIVPEAPLPPPRHAVLVCDDDRLVLATLAGALRAAGLGVIEADNGDDAILLARQHRPDLAILDMRMSGKSGLDVAAYLRDFVGLPFLFLSAYGDGESIRRARAFGAIEYLVKPIDTRQVVATVSNLLDQLQQQGPDGGDLGEGAGLSAEPLVWSRELALAVGILMEREHLNRQAAMRRLAAQAREQTRSFESMARELVDELDRRHSAPEAAPGVPFEVG